MSGHTNNDQPNLETTRTRPERTTMQNPSNDKLTLIKAAAALKLTSILLRLTDETIDSDSLGEEFVNSVVEFMDQAYNLGVEDGREDAN